MRVKAKRIGSLAGDQSDKLIRELNQNPLINGRVLKEKNSNNEESELIVFDHATSKSFAHGLDKKVEVMLPIYAYKATGQSHSIIVIDNPNGEPENEIVTIYATSSQGQSVTYRIMVA